MESRLRVAGEQRDPTWAGSGWGDSGADSEETTKQKTVFGTHSHSSCDGLDDMKLSDGSMMLARASTYSSGTPRCGARNSRYHGAFIALSSEPAGNVGEFWPDIQVPPSERGSKSMCHSVASNVRRRSLWHTVACISVLTTGLLTNELLAAEQVRSENGSMANAVYPTLTVTTLNMAKEKDADRIVQEWRGHQGIWNSDILLLQEVAHFTDGPSIAQTLAKDVGLYVATAASIANRDVDGLAIISRYPVTDFELKQLRHNGMVFHTRNRIAMAVTVHTPFGPLRVYNVHLDSRINTRARLKQIAPVISEAAQWDGPRLIGGDFNTNYLRWAGNVFPIGMSYQARAIRTAMSEKGFTTTLAHSGPTSDFLRLHLDWFYTRDIQVCMTAVEPINFSDHHAVRMTMTPYSAVSNGCPPALVR